MQRDWIMKLNDLCTDLRSFSVSAQIVEGDPTRKGSLRVISITNSSICYVKLIGRGSGDDFEWIIEHWIFDSRRLPRIDIKSFGGVDVRWEGNYQNIDILDSLSSDSAIKNAILETGDFVEIRTYPKNNYWILSEKRLLWHKPVLKQVHWECRERIADLLLTMHTQN
jgi:hypothetical protein